MMSAEFFVAVAFFAFIGILVYLGVPKTLIAGIDSRGQKIAAQLAEADRLRNEAAALLKTYEAKRIEAEKEAEGIVAAAKAEAVRLEAEAKAKLEDFVTRRTAQAEMKIAQAEAQATSDVRNAAADISVKAASVILGAAKGDDAFADGLKQIKAQLN